MRRERMVFAKYPPIAPFHGIEELLGLGGVFGRRVKRGSETVSVRQLHLERLKVIVPLNASGERKHFAQELLRFDLMLQAAREDEREVGRRAESLFVALAGQTNPAGRLVSCNALAL